jgi:hypothetical protein
MYFSLAQAFTPVVWGCYNILYLLPHLWGATKPRGLPSYLFQTRQFMPDNRVRKSSHAKGNKKTSRRQYRYRLWLLLILLSIVVVLGGWLGMILHRVQHQRRIVERIQLLGGGVIHDYQLAGMQSETASPPGPSLIRRIFGDDVFAYIEGMAFNLPHGAKDKDLALLLELPQLKHVVLQGPNFTDKGLKIVGELPNLQNLALRDTKITIAGLEHLKHLTRLKSLSVGPNISEADLSELRKSLPNCTFDIIAADGSVKTLDPEKK